MAPTKGILYIVATPIGNVADLTPRAKQTLSSVSAIVAEDTRRAGLLLSGLKIDPRPSLVSFHAQSKPEKIQQLIERMNAGETLAYISDAGTPGISDPGTSLAAATWNAGLQVVPVPGPSAFITAVSASGLPSHRLLFLGFLPKKKGRQTALKELAASPYTVVFYESTYRIEKTLTELATLLPDRNMCAAKELTKTYEHYFFGTPKQINEQITANPHLSKGEWVVIIPPK